LVIPPQGNSEGNDMMCPRLLPPIIDPSGDIQVVARSERVVLDLQGKHWRTDGYQVRDHGIIDMPIDVAVLLVDTLIEAIKEASTGPVEVGGTWGNEALRFMGSRFGSRRRHVHQPKPKHLRRSAGAEV
jgi:hypothetical protein